MADSLPGSDRSVSHSPSDVMLREVNDSFGSANESEFGARCAAFFMFSDWLLSVRNYDI
jgi:hypothetical protein